MGPTASVRGPLLGGTVEYVDLQHVGPGHKTPVDRKRAKLVEGKDFCSGTIAGVPLRRMALTRLSAMSLPRNMAAPTGIPASSNVVRKVYVTSLGRKQAGGRPTDIHWERAESFARYGTDIICVTTAGRGWKSGRRSGPPVASAGPGRPPSGPRPC